MLGASFFSISTGFSTLSLFLSSLSLSLSRQLNRVLSYSLLSLRSFHVSFQPLYRASPLVSLSRFCFQTRSTRFSFACVTGTTTIITIIVVVVCPSVRCSVPRVVEKSMFDKRPFIACTMLLLISIARVIFSLTPYLSSSSANHWRNYFCRTKESGKCIFIFGLKYLGLHSRVYTKFLDCVISNSSIWLENINRDTYNFFCWRITMTAINYYYVNCWERIITYIFYFIFVIDNLFDFISLKNEFQNLKDKWEIITHTKFLF